MQLTLDKFGRMVLPKSLRDDLGVVQGDRFNVVEREGGIWLEPVRNQDPIAHENGVLVFTGEATGDLVKAVDDQRRARLDRASGWRKGR